VINEDSHEFKLLVDYYFTRGIRKSSGPTQRIAAWTGQHLHVAASRTSLEQSPKGSVWNLGNSRSKSWLADRTFQEPTVFPNRPAVSMLDSKAMSNMARTSGESWLGSFKKSNQRLTPAPCGTPLTRVLPRNIRREFSRSMQPSEKSIPSRARQDTFLAPPHWSSCHFPVVGT
jgi:hypothetical protein